MVRLVRTTSENKDFQSLVKLLDADLALKNGDENDFYAAYNTIDTIKNSVLYFVDDKAVACGAFKAFANDTVEIKRMFVLPEYRGKGIARLLLANLEHWACENHYSTCVLETGKENLEAVNLYTKAGYIIIPNYGQYIGIEQSVCMKKVL